MRGYRAAHQERMETIDEEFVGASTDFIDRANRDKKPFFVCPPNVANASNKKARHRYLDPSPEYSTNFL